MQTTSSLQIDEFWAVARQVASERGGLVVGITGDEQPELGSTLDSVLGFQTPVPVTVTAVAEWNDWKQQADAFHRLRPSWGRGHPGDPAARYYRVRFDDENALHAAWPVTLWVVIRLSRGRGFIFLGSLLGILCYEVISTTICGSSLGKRMLSLQVLQENGSPCGLRSALIRELGYFVDSLFFGLVGYAAMRGDDQQQRYGDEWAGTIVCHMSDVPHKSLQSGTRFLLGLTAAIAADIACLLMGFLLQMLA